MGSILQAGKQPHRSAIRKKIYKENGGDSKKMQRARENLKNLETINIKTKDEEETTWKNEFEKDIDEFRADTGNRHMQTFQTFVTA